MTHCKRKRKLDCTWVHCCLKFSNAKLIFLVDCSINLLLQFILISSSIIRLELKVYSFDKYDNLSLYQNNGYTKFNYISILNTKSRSYRIFKSICNGFAPNKRTKFATLEININRFLFCWTMYVSILNWICYILL